MGDKDAVEANILLKKKKGGGSWQIKIHSTSVYLFFHITFLFFIFLCCFLLGNIVTMETMTTQSARAHQGGTA